jgi:hypothetical protein
MHCIQSIQVHYKVICPVQNKFRPVQNGTSRLSVRPSDGFVFHVVGLKSNLAFGIRLSVLRQRQLRLETEI